jgi:RNA polymerase sigma factor (sigma-70 family)
MSDDRRLLREYVESGSRKALQELIQRHLELIYSSALRQVRDPNLAEDVTQAVFVVLTQKAGTIRNGVAVGGWLLAATRYVVVTVMRKQAIKAKHERRAARPEALEAAAEEWQEIAPLLDAELNRLRNVDRDAVVLRFFQDRSFAEIGAELGFSEEAARKRVGRALEHLRARLGGRSTTLTAGGLAVAMGAYGVQAAPGHLLAGTIAASVGSATPHCISLARGALDLIAWTKAKLVGTVAASVLMGGTGAVVVTHSIAHRMGGDMLGQSVILSQNVSAAEPAPAAPPAAAAPAAPPAPAAPAASPAPAAPAAQAAPPAPAGPHGVRGNEKTPPPAGDPVG